MGEPIVDSEDQVQAPAAQTAAVEQVAVSKKKGLPNWVSALVVLVCLAVVFAVYSQMTQTKADYLKPKKYVPGG